MLAVLCALALLQQASFGGKEGAMKRLEQTDLQNAADFDLSMF